LTIGSSWGDGPKEAPSPRTPMNHPEKTEKRGVEEDDKNSGHKAKG